MTPSWMAAAALMAGSAGIELPAAVPAATVLQSPAFEVYASAGGLKARVRAPEELARFGCAARSYADFGDTLADPSSGVAWLAAEILSIDLAPIRVRLVGKPATEYVGVFRHKGRLLLAPDPGIIEVLCTTRELDSGATLLHEMGHLFMYRAYGYRLLPDPFGPGHAATYLGLTSPGSAWVEGFANAVRMSYRPQDAKAPCGWEGDCSPDHFHRIHALGPKDPEWPGLSWRQRISNEHFVDAMLWAIDGRQGLARVMETMRRAKDDLRGGRHMDFDQFLQHFLRLHPEEAWRARDAAVHMGAAVDLPEYLP